MMNEQPEAPEGKKDDNNNINIRRPLVADEIPTLFLIVMLALFAWRLTGKPLNPCHGKFFCLLLG